MVASRMDLQSCCLLLVLLFTVALAINRDKVNHHHPCLSNSRNHQAMLILHSFPSTEILVFHRYWYWYTYGAIIIPVLIIIKPYILQNSINRDKGLLSYHYCRSSSPSHTHSPKFLAFPSLIRFPNQLHTDEQDACTMSIYPHPSKYYKALAATNFKELTGMYNTH